MANMVVGMVVALVVVRLPSTQIRDRGLNLASKIFGRAMIQTCEAMTAIHQQNNKNSTTMMVRWSVLAVTSWSVILSLTIEAAASSGSISNVHHHSRFWRRRKSTGNRRDNEIAAKQQQRPQRHHHEESNDDDEADGRPSCCRSYCYYRCRGGGSNNNHNMPPPPPPVGVVAGDDHGLRIAYQGEPGAYSEKATRELLGQNVMAIGRPSFEACFRAVASMECDYACLPIENSLGGSIHDNYDLMLRYDLQIVAEHDFRVQHCFLARPGVKREDIKFAISHPQALAQCDNYLRGLGITPIATYDTAGSAKMLANGEPLPDRCKPENTAAIASNLAGVTYGLHCLEQGIEDDDTNFTRFLLLGRKSVVQYLSSNKQIPAKTSVVFTFPNTPGGLYKCLACFSLRDIDFSKIESRPTSASLLNYLKFRSQQQAGRRLTKNDPTNELPRFRYCFYLDFLASQLDENAQNALAHLREHADFVRILGSYPQKSRLVGPVKDSVEMVKRLTVPKSMTSLTSLPSDAVNKSNSDNGQQQLNIGIVGLGPIGRILAKRLSPKHRVSCMDKEDMVRLLELVLTDWQRPHAQTNTFNTCCC
jgi:arogenate/prephenate dehydratase